MSEQKTMTMTVSMDGLRMNLARAYTKAVNGYHYMKSADTRWDREQGEEDLKEGLADIRQMTAALMCTYSDNPDDSMSNLADECDNLPWVEPEGDDDE